MGTNQHFVINADDIQHIERCAIRAGARVNQNAVQEAEEIFNQKPVSPPLGSAAPEMFLQVELRTGAGAQADKNTVFFGLSRSMAAELRDKLAAALTP